MSLIADFNRVKSAIRDTKSMLLFSCPLKNQEELLRRLCRARILCFFPSLLFFSSHTSFVPSFKIKDFNKPVSLLGFTKKEYQTKDTGLLKSLILKEGTKEVCEAAALTGCVP